MIVTGSAGLIGTKLAEALAADYRVIGLDLMPPERGIGHRLRPVRHDQG